MKLSYELIDIRKREVRRMW